MDKIHIREIKTRCIIGINEEERVHKQDVVINIALHTDLSTAGSSDNIDDTVNYVGIKKDVVRMVENSRFNLIEKMAQEIAVLCLSDSRVEKCTVTVDKPQALRYARSVAVEITRSRS